MPTPFTPTPTSPTNPALATTLPVVETFHSVQGEGTWLGCSAFFIRLAGCDVGCPWCDTKHSWHHRHPHQPVEQLIANAKAAQPKFVVITGGEPLMHNLDDLTHGLMAQGLRVHIETSGAHPLSGKFDWITLSPKRYKPPHPGIYSQVNELKVVIAEPEDFDWAEAQAAKTSPDAIKLLQPEWNTPDSQAWIVDYVMRHPDWRVGLQTHKFLRVR